MSKKPATVAVVGKNDVVLLAIADLKTTIVVRKYLDDDRVLQFMELYESAAEVPPIKVVRGTMEIEDGRHRKAALEHLDRKHAECELVEPGERHDLVMRAFAANFGGAMPPTRADVTFVMKQLLEEGMPSKHIIDRFSAFYKPSHARKLLRDAHSAVLKARMTRAKNAVAHGNTTVKVAAEKFGVNPELLKDEIMGVKRKRRDTNVSDIKSKISNRYRGNTTRTVGVFRSLLDQFEDGELSESDVLDVILHVKRLNMDAAKRVDQWVERFKALKGSVKAKS